MINELMSPYMWINRGFKVFPLAPNSKAPNLGQRGFKDAVESEDDFNSLRKSPEDNVGIVLENTKYLVIDVDRHNGVDNVAALGTDLEEMKETYYEITPNDGYHFFYMIDPKKKIGVPKTIPVTLDNGAHVEITLQHLVVSPSKINGKAYTPHGTWEDVQLAPDWVNNAIAERKRLREEQQYIAESIERASVDDTTALRAIQSYIDRHSDDLQEEEYYKTFLFEIVGNVLDNEISETVANRAVVLAANGNPDWVNNNKRDLAYRLSNTAPGQNKLPFKTYFGLNKAPEYQYEELPEDTDESQPKQKKLDISALADEYHEQEHSEKAPDTTHVMGLMMTEYKFVILGHEENSPLAVYDKENGLYRTSDNFIDFLILQEAPRLTSRQITEVHQKISWQALSCNRVEPTKDKNLIPVKNGIFKVDTGELLPFSSDYIFTSKIATPFDPDAKEPELGPNNWKPSEWLTGIANYNDDVNTLLWQVIHASINGSFSYRKSIWLLGKGNDGKGTFQELIMGVVGPQNTAALKINDFSQRFAMAQLVGKSVVIGDDVPAGVYLDDSSNFNAVVTGDVVQVEQKNRPAYAMQLTPTVIQSTNEMPKFKNTSNGTNRRLIIVPFNHQFTSSNDDWRIKDEYVTNPDVSKWVLKKALTMDRFEKFIEPDVVQKQLEVFKEENHPLSGFKEDIWDRFEPDVIPTAALHFYYIAYCKENAQRQIMSRKKFVRKFYELISDHYEKKLYSVKDTSWAFDGLYPRDITDADIDNFKGRVQCFYKLPQLVIPHHD